MKSLRRRALAQITSRIMQPISAMVYALLMVTTLVLQGCQSTPIQNQVTITGSNKILLVNSNSNVERYRVAEQSFSEQFQQSSYHRIDLSGESNPVGRLQSALNQNQYDSIYCIGAKALGSIDTISPEQRIVFSSVLNWQRFQNHPRVSGIASDIAPASQLAMFKYFFPEIKTIGVLYSAFNQALIHQAQKAADQLGLTLNAIKMENGSLLNEQVKELAVTAQALWLISDPVTLASADQAKNLLSEADNHSLPVFSTLRFFSKSGATFTISADSPTIGRQAAVMIQQDQSSQQKIQHPVGSYISVNLKKVSEYGLTLNYQALDSVNELIE